MTRKGGRLVLTAGREAQALIRGQGLGHSTTGPENPWKDHLGRTRPSSRSDRPVWQRTFGARLTSGKEKYHADNLHPCADYHLRGCDCRVFRGHVDTEAGVGVVVSSGLASGLAYRMALWLARLLLGATQLRRSSACGCRQGVDPAALEWSLLGPRTLGIMVHPEFHACERVYPSLEAGSSQTS